MVGTPDIIVLVVPGGTADVEDFIVGQLRELRVDTDNDSLRLHDGVKEGGYEFLNRDQSDSRYQARNVELDGFDFSAQGKGILCRVGPSTYRLRSVTSQSGDLTFLNVRGTAGDIDFRISDEVTTDHLWSGVNTYVQRIQAEDGLAGNTYGTHNGNVVGGLITGDFTGTGHGDFDGTFTGDVDVSGHNFITDDGQITENQIDPQAWIRRGLPLGAIILWSGIVSTIPQSFQLCDGTNGTPDLRNRFIMGAGTGLGFAVPGETGGSTSAGGSGTIGLSGDHSHPLSIDGHALTIAEMPAHYHADGICNGDPAIYNHGSVTAVPDSTDHVAQNSAGGAGVEGLTTTVGGGDAHTHSGNTTTSGAHTHSLTLDDVTITPPYYALCYIMKMV